MYFSRFVYSEKVVYVLLLLIVGSLEETIGSRLHVLETTDGGHASFTHRTLSIEIYVLVRNATN